ncbi:TadE/TadG family type IV pilus assembly protein [Planobispora longispora]|uniref:TadE/TadG family type IV pilus assembly protein n=1 Tax=Planobispora longispora TaxID=28887 RepID=UPI0023B25854|nr:TadE family protein [Planobispora longispora]
METALMLPVILFLLFAIIDFGRMFNAQVTLTEAAREGARAVALGHLAGPRVESAAYGLSPLSTTVTACPITPDPGADAVVEVRHSFEFITPVTGLAALFGGGLDGPITLTGRGVMPCLG